jgi:hypothetical protein
MHERTGFAVSSSCNSDTNLSVSIILAGWAVLGLNDREKIDEKPCSVLDGNTINHRHAVGVTHAGA